MVRYFHLLCLLICIEWTFCYEYISEQNNYKSVKKIGRNSKARHRKYNEDKIGLRHKYEIERQDIVGKQDRDPVALIDLANFIQKPDYDAVEENFLELKNINRRGASDYNDYGQANLEDSVLTKGNDYIANGNVRDLNLNPDSFKTDVRNNYDTEESNVIHKPQKKCALKHMKFPFFSRKKSPKQKKNKKRKLFGRNKNNKNTGVASSSMKSTEASGPKSPYDLYKIRKRSSEENVCPLCRRKFKSKKKLDRQEVASNLIHNSRQYYQNVKDTDKYKYLDVTSNETSDNLAEEYTDDNAVSNYDEVERRKRDSRDYERERQLKELDEVQKKVDKVEINAPTNRKGSLI